MKFGARLLSSQHPPWSEHYIDYCRLKQLLHPLFNLEVRDTPRIGNGDQGNADGLDVELTPACIDGVASSGNADGSGGYMDPSYAINASLPLQAHVSTDEISSLLHQDGLAGTSHHDANHASQPAMTSSHDFQKELNYEIKKAVLFVLKSMGELASDLSELMKQQRSTSTNMKQLLDGNKYLIPETQIQPQNQEHELMVRQKLEEIYNLRMEYLVRIGSKLLLLLEFVELSIDAVIKIVKKHDKFLAKWASSSLTRSITKYAISSEDQYVRLRRQYLPRFAMHSSDPNLRCLFLLAADAGDSGNKNGEQGHQALGSQLDGSFGGWNVMQYNLEVSLRELFNWEKGLQKVTSNVKVRTTSLGSIGCLKFDADNMKMADDNDVAIKEEPAYERTISWKALTRSISGTHQTLVSRSTSFIGLAASAISPKKSQSKKDGEYAFFEPIIYRIKSSRRRLGQTTHRYSAMVYAHEMLHLIEDKNIHEEDEMLYLMQRRNSSVLGSMKELEEHHHQQDCTCDECKIKKWMEPFPTVSRLSKFLNLASSSLYMCNYVSISSFIYDFFL